LSIFVPNIRRVCQRTRAKLYILALVLALVALLLSALWPNPVLEVRAGPELRLVKVIPVASGERITYSYVHSVQKTPVDEIIEVSAGGYLVVRETVYDMYGAGLPSDFLCGDYSIDAQSGKFRISNMSREMHSLPVRVAFTPGQTLEVRGEKTPLSSLAPPTTQLVIQVATMPRAATLMRQGQEYVNH
jgi:hypothetical protein